MAAHLVAVVAAGAVRDALQFAPVPALGACCATLAAIYTICNDLKAQKQQAIELCNICNRVLAAINAKISSTPGENASPLPPDSSLASNIQQLEIELTAIYEDLKSMSGQSFIKRLMKKENHADLLSGHLTKLRWAVEVFEIQNLVDIAALVQLDHDARRRDAASLQAQLEAITANDTRLEEGLQLGFEGTAARMAEIRDLLLLALRQKNHCPPGPERKFYELTQKKMISLSGGVEPPIPPWVVSSLEVDCIEIIGSGAHSQVYRGKWNGEEVAVKRLVDGVSDETFMKEAGLWAKLDHPRIHRFLRACLSPKYIISAYHRYGDVGKYLSTHPVADRVALMRDSAAGMDFLHKNGGIHGDLKASNVLVDDGGKACIR